MPFIQRIIEPVFLSRPTQQSPTPPNAADDHDDTDQPSTARAVVKPKPSSHDDFTAIANCTLANILRQLGSVVHIADAILSDLGTELHTIRVRSNNIQKRIVGVEKSLENVDATIIYKTSKKIFIDDDNDVSIYKTKRTISTSLFTASTRPQHIQRLYEQAAPTLHVPILCNGGGGADMYSDDDNFSTVCPTISFGHTRRQITKKIDAEIETRVPAAIEELRKWTSSEAIGDITVAPNCLIKVGTSSLQNHSTIAEESYASFSTSYVDGIDITSTSTNDNVDGPPNDLPLDHKLPSPEEQCATIALKYPAEIVRVNTSNVRFERMCSIRKSLGHVPMGKVRYLDEFQATRRSLRPRKSSGKRRNTIAGIDDKDIKEAYTQLRHSAVVATSSTATVDDGKSSQSMPRSKSNDLLKSNGTIDSFRTSNRFSNFKALKQWGKYRLKFINKIDENGDSDGTSTNAINQSDSLKSTKAKAKSAAEKHLKQNPLYSSTEKLFTNLIENDVKVCVAATNPVKLRTSLTRRQRRNKHYRCEEPNSSSGNWSASSESGRTSASSEIAMQKKASNSCGSLNQNNKPNIIHSPATAAMLTKRRINTSTSSSITSDDTMTHEMQPGYADSFDDNESMYSCDTEGYFTSFHVDSGLKTLKEEESSVVPAMLSTSALLPIDGSNVSSSFGDSLSRTTVSMDSDYEMFGKGSTSTTASSGTVCTALLGSLSNNSLVEMPVAPERKSSLNSKLINISNYGKPKQLTSKMEMISKRMVDKEAKEMREALHTTNNFDKIESADSCDGSSSGGGGGSGGRAPVISDLEISENSDFEGVERVKRIRGKTQINSTRIPSICIITPLNSDDEDRVAAMESMLSSLNINQKDLPLSELGEKQTIAQVHSIQVDATKKISDEKVGCDSAIECGPADEPDTGEYVTITDVRVAPAPRQVSDIVNDDLDRVLSGNFNMKTQYVSLNELPSNAKYDDENLLANEKNVRLISGTNVKFNANGMFVYDSSTLRYKRSLCTTFKGTPMATVASDHTNQNVATTPNSGNIECAANKEDKRMSDTQCSPPFEKMASNSDSIDSTGLDDVYVTLATDKCGLHNTTKPNISVSDSELSDSSRETKSDIGPMFNEAENKAKTVKRRFSWENLVKSSDSKKRSKSKRRRRKFALPLDFSGRKSTPKQMKPAFKTSTPLKAAAAKETSSRDGENVFGNSTSISQVTPNKPNQSQTTTCSDRLGAPKTSLNDFKKLLLNATNKQKLTSKPSAVEQLKLKHESLGTSPMKILELSASPKSFMNRRHLQSTPATTASPYKKPNLMSPRSRWKYSNFSKSSIASIPEANVEDDVTATTTATSTATVDDQQSPAVKIESDDDESKTNPIHAQPKQKKLAVIIENVMNQEPQTPSKSTSADALEPIIAKTESSPETGIIETNFTMQDNIFLQAEENNFMRGEIKPFARKILHKLTAEESQTEEELSATPTLETSF